MNKRPATEPTPELNVNGLPMLESEAAHAARIGDPRLGSVGIVMPDADAFTEVRWRGPAPRPWVADPSTGRRRRDGSVVWTQKEATVVRLKCLAGCRNDSHDHRGPAPKPVDEAVSVVNVAPQ